LPAIAGTSGPAEENVSAEYEEMKVKEGRKEESFILYAIPINLLYTIPSVAHYSIRYFPFHLLIPIKPAFNIPPLCPIPSVIFD
jgi:hypothetical protein